MPEPTASQRVANALFYGFLILLAWLAYLVFEPFLTPLGWAAVLVVVFHPWYVRLEKRWGALRAALASTVAVTLILIVPALLLMGAFVHQGIGAAASLQQGTATGQFSWLNRAWGWLLQHFPGESPSDLTTLAKHEAETVASFLASQLGTVLRHIALFLFDLVVTIFALFYFFRDAGAIMNGLRRALPFGEPHRERMITQARELIYASVTSSLVVAAVHGLLGGIAFALVGISAAVFWGVVMAFFSLLPLVGAWVIWLPAAAWLISQGRVGRGIALVAICAVAVAAIDNFLRPFLISGHARLSGLVVFISVLGGIKVFGLLGVVLGPIVVATAAGVFDAYTRGDTRQEVNPPRPGPVGKSPRPVLE